MGKPGRRARVVVHDSVISEQGQSALARLALDHMTTAIVIVDRRMELLDMNPAAEALLDVSLNQRIGQPLADLLAQPDTLTRALRRVIDSVAPLTERELSLHVSGRDTVTADCVITPLDANATRILIELVVLDRHMQLSREQRLVEESEVSRVVLRGLAHEIRNPLGGLRGAAQLLERELIDPDLREYTQIIVHEADRLQSLLDRMVGPRRPPRLEVMNVHQVTERVFALVHAEAPPGVTVDKDYDPSIPDMDADPEQLIQAVLNVARNAVQAVGETGSVLIRTRVQRQIGIGSQHHRLAARIDVVDDGPGIPDDLGNHIFYPLVTGRSDGTGLGLSIAQSLVNQHGGLIECRSQPGRTEFSILLPIRRELGARSAR